MSPALPLEHFRAFARQPVGLSAIVNRRDSDWKAPARLLDLGLGGARLELAEPLPLGAALLLSVEAPHLWDPLLLEAEVVWLEPLQGAAQLGVRFRRSSGRNLRRLIELLEAEAYH